MMRTLELMLLSSLLDFCCELHFLIAAHQTQRQSNALVMAINHTTFCLGVMTEDAYSAAPDWNMYIDYSGGGGRAAGGGDDYYSITRGSNFLMGVN